MADSRRQFALNTIRKAIEQKATHLDLGGNRLTALPIEIGQLTELKSLDLSGNHLSTLPPEIVQLTKLETLDLFSNQFTNLSSEILKLNRLDSLNLGDNKLTSLPDEARTLKTLKTLNLRGNPLPIPPEILEKNTDAVSLLSYYFERSKRPLNEIKLLVVGQGSVGKSSLIQRILSNTYDPNRTKTDGISINLWQFDRSGMHFPIRINVWDFGGQEIMHATHQFFLSKRSIYLLVLNARQTQEENRAEYWLKIIQSFGGDSPIIVVGNQIDEHPFDIDKTGLKKKYPNIVDIIETSAKKEIGISDLCQAIINQVEISPQIHDLLPETWFTVKTRLEGLGVKRSYLTYSDYVNLCVKNNIINTSDQHSLIGFLHDLGVMLHFQDDPYLESLGILNPKWVTDGVYKIINSNLLFQTHGKLSLDMLNSILNSPDYPSNMRLFIIEMMKKFEICYEIDPHSFLVPDLLPKDEPFTGDWNNVPSFLYQYNVLPTSIISRFIVRMNPFIHKTIWRSGVVLKSNSNLSLVKADYEDRTISIWVNGNENTRRDFLSAIRSQFESIHKTIAKVDVIEKVPHPEYPGLVIDYRKLLEFERQKISEYPETVSDKVIMIKVSQLLEGVGKPLEEHQSDTPQIFKAIDEISLNDPKPKHSNRLLVALTNILTFPAHFGRFILDLFGRHDSANSTSIILGWFLILTILLFSMGFITPHGIVRFFADIWRFFNPVK